MKKILIARQDFGLGKFLKTMLRDEGFEVMMAVTQEEVFEKVALFKPDIMLLDLFFLGISNLQFIKDLKFVNSQTKIIILSPIKDELATNRALNYGADQIVHLPFALSGLVAIPIAGALNTAGGFHGPVSVPLLTYDHDKKNS